MREISGDTAGHPCHLLPPTCATQLRLQRALRGDVLGHDLNALAVTVRAVDLTAIEAQRDRLPIAIEPTRVERLTAPIAPTAHRLIPPGGIHHHGEAGCRGKHRGRRVVSQYHRHCRIQIQQTAVGRRAEDAVRRGLHERFVELPVLELDRLQLRVFLGLSTQCRIVLRFGVAQQRAELLERGACGAGETMEIGLQIAQWPSLLDRRWHRHGGEDLR